jgi:predicted RNA-binding protein with PIN domain
MHYIVDGYNLLFRILTPSLDLELRRKTIIENLNKKIQLVGIDVTIVFDSNYRIDESLKSHYKHLEIQFTSRGITADDWIIDKVRCLKTPESEIVVTSDKKLAWTVRYYSAKTESVEEFITNLNKRYKNKLAGIKENTETTSKTSLKTPLIQLKPLKKKTPTICKMAPSESFDYYLKQFEENFNKIAKPEKPPAVEKQKKHEFPKKKKDPDEHLSDMERWLKAFERNTD